MFCKNLIFIGKYNTILFLQDFYKSKFFGIMKKVEMFFYLIDEVVKKLGKKSELFGNCTRMNVRSSELTLRYEIGASV